MTATGPVSGVRTPSLIVLPSKPGTALTSAALPPPPPLSSSSSCPQPAPTSPSAATAASAAILVALMTLLQVACQKPASVRKRPRLEVRLHPQPHGGEAARLEDQEQHDQQAEDSLVE